jgi:hypothetical protein
MSSNVETKVTIMRHIAVLAVAACVLAAGAARAGVVSVSYTAVVTTQSGDIQDLFGMASIIGDTISGTYSYDTAAFGASRDCGAGCAAWDSTGGAVPNGTISMSQTIAGVTLTVNGMYYNGLLLGNAATPGDWQYNGDGWIQTFQILSEQTTPYATVDAIEINLGRLDDAATLVDPGLMPGGQVNLGAASVQSNGTDWATAAGAASWGFAVDQTDVPEPGSLMVLATGLVGLAACGRARFRNRTRHPT